MPRRSDKGSAGRLGRIFYLFAAFDRQGYRDFSEGAVFSVEVIFIGGPVGTAALAAGELDYSASTDSGMPAAVQGVPIKAVLFAHERAAFLSHCPAWD